MEEHKLSLEQIADYSRWLRREERTPATAEKYLRAIRAFACWLEDRPVDREAVAQWKERLVEKRYAPATVNAVLAALNGLFRFLGWEDCRARFLKVQRKMFRDRSRELTRPDYDKLVAAARERGQQRLAMLMETVCATGIRVSEVRYITQVVIQENGRRLLCVNRQKNPGPIDLFWENGC